MIILYDVVIGCRRPPVSCECALEVASEFVVLCIVSIQYNFVEKEGVFISRFITALSDKVLSVFHYYDQD